MAIPNLTNSVLNLTALREGVQQELLDILWISRDKKALILDPSISGPINLIADVKFLKENTIEKIYHITSVPLETESNHLLYMVRPRVEYMRIIAEHVRLYKQTKQFYLCFVDGSTTACERALEEEGIFTYIQIRKFDLGLIPFDTDLMSMELGSLYRECLLEGDTTSLLNVAKSIMKIQSTFGFIPKIKGLGNCSKMVYDMLVQMRTEMTCGKSPIIPEIDTLILIDREVDMVTPCCTQLTYEGLIDEEFSIHNGSVKLPSEMVGNNSAATNEIVTREFLNSGDPIHYGIRDRNINQVGKQLHQKAVEIKEFIQSRLGLQTVAEVRDFTHRLATMNQQQSRLAIHTNITERLHDLIHEPSFLRRVQVEKSLLAGVDIEDCSRYLEECISRRDAIGKVLRLLVIFALTNSGSPDRLRYFKYKILEIYGDQIQQTFTNLEKLGLLNYNDDRLFPRLRENLSLIVEDQSLAENPTDVAYVYANYAPLSIRLIQQAVGSSGWRPSELLRGLPGPPFEEQQQMPLGVTRERSGRPKVLVFFIGGVTFAEIAALRYMTRAERPARDFIIATSKLINGYSMLESVRHVHE